MHTNSIMRARRIQRLIRTTALSPLGLRATACDSNNADADHKAVAEVADMFYYPPTAGMIRVAVSTP